MPPAAQDFVDLVEHETDLKVGIIGVGTEIDQFVAVH